MDLQGKTVLVTGASSGIGKAVAIAFAQRRAHVLVHYGKNQAGAQETLDEVKTISSGGLYQGDLMNRDQIASLFKDIKQMTPTIDVLVNNAGDAKPISTTMKSGTMSTRTFSCPPCR
jgi:NAD(P)-dependent dehydrogenase (short-subunit alcohol dehydrogenase family)